MFLVSANPVFWAALTGALTALAVVPGVIWASHRLGWVAQPKADRWHRRPTALMGGIGLYLAVSASWLLFAPPSAPVPVMLAGATLMFIAGLVDDLRDISPATKLVAQLAAASLIFYGGLRLDLGGVLWLSYLATLLWVVGVTNAVNLLDNMDGLAAGVTAIAAGSLGTLVLLMGDPGTAALAWGICGAALGFLAYNFHPARIFMGDCGSLFLGFSIAALALAVPTVAPTSGVALVFVLPAAVMAVPIFDTTLVTAKRLLSRRPISQGGRDHSSHRLVWLGLSERRAVLTLYAVSMLFGGLAVAFHFLEVYLLVPLLAVAVTALALFGVFLFDVKVYEPEVERRTARRLTGMEETDGVFLRTVFRNKRQVLGVVVDMVLVVSALVIAYHLRFDLQLPEGQQKSLGMALPVVVALKLLTLFAAGMYRRMWRYTGSREIVAVIRASTIGSVLSVLGLVLLYRFAGFSRTLFVLDWVLATTALVASRGALRGLHGYFSAHRIGGRPVLLYGAGGGGSLAVRELGNNPQHGLVPVGFVDDDPSKQRLMMHGLRVLGSGADLARLRASLQVEEVILTATELEPERLAHIRKQCALAGLRVRQMRISFAPLSEGAAAAAPAPEPAEREARDASGRAALAS